MAANIKHRSFSDMNEPKSKFEFDKSFKRQFDAVIGLYSNALSDLHSVIQGKGISSDYGVCNCSYKMRYVTPKDVSTYISNLINGIESGLFNNRSSDIEMFAVASVKRFLEDNGCDPFETSSAIDSAKRYVNPSEYTLNDLAHLCEHDMGQVAVYSKGEILQRLKLMAGDVKKMDDLHFAANMKKVVSALPDVIMKNNSRVSDSPSFRFVFGKFVQEFIIFVCTMNTITLLQLIGYGSPTVDYSIKTKENSDEVVTECCLVKTNDYMIRNNLPFNCNMRDIVLQDVTPDFRDIHDALHFIMKDSRSPISILVNKFATKEATVGPDMWMLGQMFLGTRHDMWDDDVFDKNTGARIIGGSHPHDIANFKTDVTWLDNIAYGNNYLDGNYRRDGVGHHKVHPIVNTLDTLYKILGGYDLKSNEDIANNIVRIACLMRSIINENRSGESAQSYDVTKDILTVLGEIFTRNMLRLYYNNTRVFVYGDDMPDTGDPGLIYFESFVMEADNSNTPNVSFSNSSGQNVKSNMKTKTSILINNFLKWVRDTMSKFSDNFNKNHQKEIEYINKNASLHDEIGNAIRDGQFNPNLSNFPSYKIPAEKLSGINITEIVKKYQDVEKAPKFDADEFVYECLPKDDTLINALKKETDANKKSEIWNNYVMFGKPETPQLYTGKMSADQWKELYTDLKETAPLVKQITDKFTKDLSTASEDIKSQLQKYEMVQGDDQKVATQKERLENINKCIQIITKTYESAALNSLVKNFYGSGYKMYVAIITNYRQQKSNSSNNQQNDNNNQQQQTQQNQQTNTDQTAQNNGDSLNTDNIPS